MKKAFVAYARADKDMVGRLLAHLKGLKYAKKLETWYDGEIAAGEQWEEQISNQMSHSDIVIFCVSADFLESEYVQTVEMPRALERNRAGQCRVIPVILRSCVWQCHDFARLQVIPEQGKPVASYAVQDEAWTEVTQAIVEAIISAPTDMESPRPEEKTPVLGGAPAKRFHKAPSDQDIDEYVLETIASIRRYFQASIKNLQDANPGWQGKIHDIGDDAFEATIYAHGRRKAHCGIFQASSWGVPTIGYSTSGVGGRNAFNDTLSLAQGGKGPILKWQSLTSGGFWQFGDQGFLDTEQACEHLWNQFVQHLE